MDILLRNRYPKRKRTLSWQKRKMRDGPAALNLHISFKCVPRCAALTYIEDEVFFVQFQNEVINQLGNTVTIIRSTVVMVE